MHRRPTPTISYFLLPLLYLAIGGTVTAMLVQRILHYAATVWLVLLLPMVMVTVLLTVAGIVNVWLSYRTWHESGLLRQYSQRSLLGLYLRCWGVVMAGLSMGVVFAWMYQLLPDDVQLLTDHLALLFYILCGVLTLAALMSIVLGENLQEIRLRNAQTENHLLKSQLNPHFLYNTLNNIDALIWLDQERASQAVTSLSDLMRYVTYSARQESVPLQDEARAISQLCSLQGLRMSCDEAVRLEIATAEGADPQDAAHRQIDVTDIPALQVAPLLLIPLVENCFKHCGATNEPNAVCIRLIASPNGIEFTTDNNLKSETETDSTTRRQGSGIGLEVLQRRLELLYAGRYTFAARRDGNRFRTTLTISY